MLFVISPAKSLDYETPVAPEVAALATRPAYVDRAQALIDVLARRTPAEVASLMELSDDLARLNVGRYAAWRPVHTSRNSLPAALAFDGDVYGGLSARTLPVDDLQWAQSHLVILSGLYGALRPLDRLQPYRLEMGTRLATPQADDLYGYWGDTLSVHLDRQLRGHADKTVVNLASQEYFRAVPRRSLKARVVECVFEEGRSSGSGADAEPRWQIISFFAKRARGLMARYAIEHRVDRPEGLLGFAAEGYAFAPSVSTPERLVFRRRAVSP